MTPDPDQHLNPLAGLHQVESLASISDRILRKKDQQQKKDQQHGHEKKKPVPIQKPDEQIRAKRTDIEDDGQEHVDFCA